MIDLYHHNQVAYESAMAMLSDTGRAAIIHPTGTGKSFIGFKLCEEWAMRDAGARVCWLSPSEYIFKTQLENIRATSNYLPTNITFLTYARLMLMSKEEIRAINPACIILDEFHRCGAEMWGRGVRDLLDAYPEIPLLGLSATHIRYLDNRRDMADELFDGNIASEMTLGEAIVRGILNPPKYVLSVFSYQKELETYERRAHHAKSRAVRAAAEQYLEALRRAIEMADGLDVLFDKHMTDRTGKYIVFCASKEHMDEMQTYVGSWFSRVDPHPHVYTLYSEDPTADRSFAAFKADDDNTHLRLLFVIDALNEGVHVEDVSGVILLRPTISPIIYKQQIGRALSAGRRRDPVIFDIVNNVENLYSIGAIEEEMRAAVTYYRYFGNTEDIVNERFSVFDEVRTCRELFERLDETLTASWDFMYGEAKRYFEQNRNLDIPKRYKTPEGYSLGSWVRTQRKVRAGEQFGHLDEERIARLDAIGMRWDSPRDRSWERYYSAACSYYAAHGDLNVKAVYTTPTGIRLGAFIASLRNARRCGNRSAYLTPDRIARLDALGMIWDQPDYVFERNYAAALEYYRLHGNLDVPARCTVGGVKLGIWIRNLRVAARDRGPETRLSPEQISRLDRLGMRWADTNTTRWETGFAAARRFFDEHGSLDLRDTYKTPEGYALGKWLARQRQARREGTLSPERIARLDTLSMPWSSGRQNDWDGCFALVRAFYTETGHLRIPADYTANGIWLNKWLNEQKQIYHGKRPGKQLTPEQIALLEGVGVDWRVREVPHASTSSAEAKKRRDALSNRVFSPSNGG